MATNNSAVFQYKNKEETDNRNFVKNATKSTSSRNCNSTTDWTLQSSNPRNIS